MLPGTRPSFHDPMKSVAVLPQTVVVPAGIPSLEPCLGVVGLNAAHLVAETRARIPETWACADHAVASAGGRVAGRVAGRVEGQGRGHAPPHTRLPARPPPAIANLVGASRWRTASRKFSSTLMPPSRAALSMGTKRCTRCMWSSRRSSTLSPRSTRGFRPLKGFRRSSARARARTSAREMSSCKGQGRGQERGQGQGQAQVRVALANPRPSPRRRPKAREMSSCSARQEGQGQGQGRVLSESSIGALMPHDACDCSATPDSMCRRTNIGKTCVSNNTAWKNMKFSQQGKA